MRAHEFIVISESLNSQFDNLIWEQDKRGNWRGLGKFNNDDEYFTIALNISSQNINNHRYNIVNIDFERYIPDQGSTMDLLGISKNSSRVFGAIYNAIKNKIVELNAKYSIDAISAIVDDRKRLGIYEVMLKRPYQGISYPNRYYFDIPEISSSGIIATKEKLSQYNLIEVKRYMRSLGKTPR